MKSLYPYLKFSEVVNEIKNRTGFPKEIIKNILLTYVDIAKECMINQIEIPFGDIGNFTYQFFIKNKNVFKKQSNNENNTEDDFLQYYKINFRPTIAFNKIIKNKINKLYEEKRND